jgi:hypothetical protein
MGHRLSGPPRPRPTRRCDRRTPARPAPNGRNALPNRTHEPSRAQPHRSPATAPGTKSLNQGSPSTPRSAARPAGGTTHRPRRLDQAAGRHADPGAAVDIEQDLVIEGQMTFPAMCPLHPAPRRRTSGAGGQGGGRVVPRRHRSKAAPNGRTRHRHDSAAFRNGPCRPGTLRSGPLGTVWRNWQSLVPPGYYGLPVATAELSTLAQFTALPTIFVCRAQGPGRNLLTRVSGADR